MDHHNLNNFRSIFWKVIATTIPAFITMGTALAQDATTAAPAAPKIDTGDTAWVLTSAALVLLMTPGLAFFYGGMVRVKNVLSTLFQNFAALGAVGFIWGAVGYSLAFSGKSNGWIGVSK